MLYFAYGSNMSVSRLACRIVWFRPMGPGTLYHHKLAFHKRSFRDGSGKCDAHYTGEKFDKVIGVLYRILESDLPALDEIEGVGDGYERSTATVFGPAGESVDAQIYYATHIDSSLKPLHWYKEHVLQGALENRLPLEYVRYIRSIPAVIDSDRSRTSRELSIYG